jgi:uncharacterized membrane protein
MANENVDFDKLVNEQPTASEANTLSVRGIVFRHAGGADKFVLELANGARHTLDKAAVRSHKVVAKSMGRSHVQLELDAERIPKDLRAAVQAEPFVVASPHQAEPIALESGGYTRTYFSAYVWARDYGHIHKAHTDPA